jgi:hypothetical protein
VYFGEGTSDPMFGGWARMYVCGFCRFDPDYLGLDGDFVQAIQLYAVNTKDQKVYPGRFHRRGFIVKPPKREDDGWEPIATGQWFNPNLTKVTSIPQEEGDYSVYATLGDYKSNTVTIKLRRKPK